MISFAEYLRFEAYFPLYTDATTYYNKDNRRRVIFLENEKDVIQDLIRRAMKAREYSYSPYSNFSVGAAILSESGKIYTGCNIESASYTPTICAERVALFKAVSEGERKFKMLALVGGPKNEEKKTEEIVSPCGVCRQMLYEFGKDLKVVMADNEEKYEIRMLEELLPYGFGPDNLI